MSHWFRDTNNLPLPQLGEFIDNYKAPSSMWAVSAAMNRSSQDLFLENVFKKIPVIQVQIKY